MLKTTRCFAVSFGEFLFENFYNLILSQFLFKIPYDRDDGSKGKRVRPYIIDLESANGTFVNNKQIESKKYVELLEKDVIKFGFSSREYVLLHENSKDEQEDDDVLEVENEVQAEAV